MSQTFRDLNIFFIASVYKMSGNLNDTNPSKLGGGIPGFQPGLLGGGANSNSGTGMVGSSARSRNRFIMRDAMGKITPIASKIGLTSQQLSAQASLTPFRAATNAGDLRNAVNSAPAPGMPNANQIGGVGQLRSMVFGIGDGTRTGSALYSGNPRYVYDSSDYTRFKKLGAELSNYNDLSFGGSNNGSYTFIMNVRS